MHLIPRYLRLIVALTLSLMADRLLADPDYAREQRWANEVISGLVVGEAIYLQQPNKHRFLGLYAPVRGSATAVIVAHGMGLHPDWGMIGTIRQRLYDNGYTTLSIQMPVLAADADFKEYVALFPDGDQRLRSAVDYLKQQDHQCIVLVSHSNGSRMSRGYMATNPPDINAWVAISLTQGDTFAYINAPVLDLYGENDLPHVLNSTSQRKRSLLNPASRQQSITQADHFFNGHEEPMFAAVKMFLDEQVCKKPSS